MNIERRENEVAVMLDVYTTDIRFAHRIVCAHYDYDYGTSQRLPPVVTIRALGLNLATVEQAERHVLELAEVVQVAKDLQIEMTAKYQAKYGS